MISEPNKLKIIKSPATPDPEIVIENSIYCDNDHLYMVPPTSTYLNTISGLQVEIDRLRMQSDRRLSGLLYWKGKADE